MVLRRLLRVAEAARDGERATFAGGGKEGAGAGFAASSSQAELRLIACSATLLNPEQHLLQLLPLRAEELELVTTDGSPAAPKQVTSHDLLNPHLLLEAAIVIFFGCSYVPLPRCTARNAPSCHGCLHCSL